MAQEVRSTSPSTPSAPALAHVPFHGDMLDATKDAQGKVWVSVSRVCEALGIDAASQREKLKSKPWATHGLVPSVADDGKVRDVFCLDIDSLPMWLATIDPKRVKPAARAKLADYQRECAKVLRDFFFGVDTPRDPVARMTGLDMANLVLRKHSEEIQNLAGVRPIEYGNPEFGMSARVLGTMARELSALAEAISAYDADPDNCSFELDDAVVMLRSLSRRARAAGRMQVRLERATGDSRLKN